MNTSDTELLRTARHLWRRREFDAALAAFRSAIAAAPDNLRALLEGAQSLGLRYQIAEAEQYLTRAVELAALDGRVGPAIAQAYRIVQRPQQAIDVLARLHAAGTLPLPYLGELAILYEQTNQYAAAIAAIRECVAQAPQQPEPQLILARLLRHQGDAPLAQSILERLLAAGSRDPLLQMRAGTELAQLHDAAGDYAAALAAIRAAKQLQAADPNVAGLRSRSQGINRAFREIYAQLDLETVRRWQSQLPDNSTRCAGVAHLLSFPRSGTTLLEQQLKQHPRLVSSSERTVFSREVFPLLCRQQDHATLSLETIDNCADGVLSEARTRYFDCLEGIHGAPFQGCVHIDKNPNHTSLLVGLLRVLPESKFVFALRDPRDVVVSAYLQYWPLTEFSVAFLTWEDTCRQYMAEMDVWRQLRDTLAEQQLEVRYEDVVHDPQATRDRVWQFLRLPPTGALDEQTGSAASNFINSPSYAAVRRPIYTRAIGRWRNYEPWLARQFADLAAYCQAWGYDT